VIKFWLADGSCPTLIHFLFKILAVTFRGEGNIIGVGSRRVDTKASARKCLPQQAPVAAAISIRVRLNPSIPRLDESRVTWFEKQGVKEEVEKNDVSLRGRRVRECFRGPP